MFKIIQNKGFHMTFENGITVSVQFGVGSYCENYFLNSKSSYTVDDLDMPKNKDVWECENAEIAIWTEEETWITQECYKDLYNKEKRDNVEGYVTANEVAEIIQWAKNYDDETK